MLTTTNIQKIAITSPQLKSTNSPGGTAQMHCD